MTLTRQEIDLIQEGMKVLDSNDDRIGTVDHIRFSDEDPQAPGPETRSAHTYDRSPSIIDNLVQAFTGTDTTPDVIRERLLRHGFIRISRGFGKADAYAVMDDVMHIREDHVHLNVPEKELMTL